jgi:hypothetical protein
MTRIEIINALIRYFWYKKYLEIGVNTPAQPGYSHESIVVETKHGVDPNVDTTYRMTSDDFFAQNKEMYDIVFVDGLHIFEQAHRDIINALRFLTEGGTIIVHDCNPVREITQRPDRASSVWHGDVWKAILKLRMEEPTVQIYTVNADEGCTIIQRGHQELLVTTDPNPYTYDFFKKHKQDILHLISVREFRTMFALPHPSLVHRLSHFTSKISKRFVQLLNKI